jgi:hypothetical protein
MEIIFRNKSEVPTSPGFFYGRYHSKGEIFPVRVKRDFNSSLFCEYLGEYRLLSEFTWFGPVPVVKEG